MKIGEGNNEQHGKRFLKIGEIIEYYTLTVVESTQTMSARPLHLKCNFFKHC